MTIYKERAETFEIRLVTDENLEEILAWLNDSGSQIVERQNESERYIWVDGATYTVNPELYYMSIHPGQYLAKGNRYGFKVMDAEHFAWYEEA